MSLHDVQGRGKNSLETRRNKPTLARAVRVALAAGTASALACATLPALAQEQSSQEQSHDEIATMTVTGSRILRQDLEAASPVVTISSDTIDLSGEVQVETVLNSLPQLVPSNTTTSNNPSNGGQANVDLRGLGTQRTLVLMDGARLPGSNVNGVVDLNTIPSALIENIEILTGGASSAYGSDAIAGVINVRMKRNFSGLELSVQDNVTQERDGKTLLAEAVFGGNFAEDRGNAVIALTYDKRDAVLAAEREFSQVLFGPTLAPSGSSTVPEGAVSWGANGPSQAVLNTVFGSYGAAPGSVSPTNTIGFNTDGTLFSFGSNTALRPVVNYRGDTTDPGFNPLIYSYNGLPVNYLQLPLERRQIAAFTNYDVVPDGGVELYSRIMYTAYHSDQQLASTPVTCNGLPGCVVPLSNGTIPADLRTLANSRADNLASLAFTKRITEVGLRTQENRYDVMQGLLGFRGDFQLGERAWHWDAFGSFGRTEGTSLQGGNVSRSRLQNGLNDPAFFAARGCAEFDVFGAGGLTPACANAIAIKATNVLEFEQSNYVASVTGGLFDLPAGPVSLVIGGEYREDIASFRPDEFLSSGDVVGFNAQQPVSGRITVIEPFAELAVPILADIPGASYLGLEFGYRSSNYNNAGSHDTYKAGLAWNPVASVSVRGGYNRAIRAPNINELFAPRSEQFPQHTDPCNVTSAFRFGTDGVAGGTGGAADGANRLDVESLCLEQGLTPAILAGFNQPNTQARSFAGGNPALAPEAADTYTFGLAWQSRSENEWLSGISASVDYFKYDIENVIDALDASSIIGRCFNQLGTNPTYTDSNAACALFTRNPANLGITDVVTTQLNLAARKVSGYDANIDWSLPLTAFGAGERAGEMNFGLLLTVLDEWERQETVADDFLDRAGTISQTIGSAYPKYKGVFSTTYSVGDLSFRYNLRYVDGMDAVNSDALLTPSTGVAPTVDAYAYHDLVGRYAFNDTIGLTIGITNIGDKDPPIYTTSTQAGIQANTDPSTYDVLGRRYFINLTAHF